MNCSVCPLFFNDTATTEIYTLSLHDALPILLTRDLASSVLCSRVTSRARSLPAASQRPQPGSPAAPVARSEEHTSELQSRQYLVCRLLLEKKKQNNIDNLVKPLRSMHRPPYP